MESGGSGPPEQWQDRDAAGFNRRRSCEKGVTMASYEHLSNTGRRDEHNDLRQDSF